MKKTIIIGIDGGTWNNLMPWIKQKFLPYFAEIINNGVHGITTSTIPSLTCPAVPSFYTGKSPVKTRTFGFRKSDGGIVTSKDIKGTRFWDVLGRNNINSIIIGLRTTYPPKIKKGVLVSSLLAPSEESDFVYPHSEKVHFKGFFSEDLTKNEKLSLQNKDREKLANKFNSRIKKRFALLDKYKQNKKFDFELMYINSTDGLQHRLWNNQELILKGYKTAEEEIKKYMKKEKNANFIFFSDHGFGPCASRVFYVNQALENLNMLKHKRKWYLPRYNKLYYRIGWKLNKHLPEKMYRKVFKLVKGQKKSNHIFNIDPPESDGESINMKQTKAYLSQKWGISIVKENVTDYETFRTELIKTLEKIKDETGGKVFEKIYKKEEIYPDSKQHQRIPDIIFILNHDFEPRAGNSKNIFEDRNIKPHLEGTHDFQQKGIFMAYGPDIKKGFKLEKPINICDIAPTILHMYNIPIPNDMDGRVIKEIFKEHSEYHKRKIVRQEYSEVNETIAEINI